MAVNLEFEIFKEKHRVSENSTPGKKMFLSILKDAFFSGYTAGKKSKAESPENVSQQTIPGSEASTQISALISKLEDTVASNGNVAAVVTELKHAAQKLPV